MDEETFGSGLAKHLEWLGRGEEPTLVNELLILLLTPPAYLGLAIGVGVMLLADIRRSRRRKAERAALVASVSKGQRSA